MEVDGQPNVKACITLAKEGMVVKPQNAWPSLDHDIGSIIDKFSFLLPVGFYYKKFIHPKWLWPLARRVIRRAAGYGKVDPNLQRNEGEYEHEYRYVDVAVIGGGPAGLSAAAEAAKTGFQTLLVNDQPTLGGHLRYKVTPCNDPEFSGIKGFEAARTLIEQASSPAIEVLNDATCFGIYEGKLLGVSKGKRLIRVRAKKTIICTGCFERHFAFTNNDLPGIFLSEGVQRLINLQSITPGRTAVVVTNNKDGYEIASELLDIGVKVSAIAATNGNAVLDDSLQTKLRKEGTELLAGYTVVEAKGKREVTGALLCKINEKGEPARASVKNVPCDMIVLATGFEPANALLLQAGCEASFDERLGEPTLSSMVPSIYAAGEVTGIHDLRISVLQGRLAGLQATADLANEHRQPNPESVAIPAEITRKIAQYSEELRTLTDRYRAETNPGLLYRAPGEREKRFVCICEDLLEKDIKVAIEEGFDDIETLKRYTTFTMGPCQGKLCSLTCTAIHAEETGLKFSETKRTTSRPPYQAVTMGLLNGPPHRPVKLTPLHQKHSALNAVIMDMGEWKRPKSYGSLEQEYKAIRERVGIIDVSTLGRFIIKGPDSGKLLDLVYTHIYSNLKVGKARYALLLSETGKVLDDGIIARLSDDEYLATSSTGNAEFVENWLKWWQVTGSLNVSITNMTSGLAAINVAGPKARELLSRLVDIDISTEAAPYMSCSKANVAGVPAFMLRIGFVGEVGWELHFPAEYAEYLWDKLMAEGEGYGIRPVGVEAMRRLSLDKRHLWPTLDTDAASDALEAGLEWAVKFEKPDFVGKHYLLKTQREGLRQRFVGFIVKGKEPAANGDVVVVGDKIVGRITTANFSYALQKYVGMGWVPLEWAKEHSIIPIVHDGRRVEAEVVSGAFYDPEGGRMKS
jgi:sarcosine oxidase subunit alpha